MLRELRPLLLVPLVTPLVVACDQPLAQPTPHLRPQFADVAQPAFEVEWSPAIYGVGTAEQPYFVAPPPDTQVQFAFTVDESEVDEYEPDTGAKACPRTLYSNARMNIRINAVGDRWFTFYAPHQKKAYLGRGRYRYQMSHGFSDDDYWSAEGPWEGYCGMIGRVGIALPTEFKGTISARRTGPPPGTEECDPGSNYDQRIIYDPYSVDHSATNGCSDGTAGGEPDDQQKEDAQKNDENTVVEFTCVSFLWGDGSFYMKCTRVS